MSIPGRIKIPRGRRPRRLGVGFESLEPRLPLTADCGSLAPADADVALVVRGEETPWENYTAFTANPATDTGHGVGRLEVVQGDEGPRLEYELRRMTAFDFTGQMTPDDASDDVVSVSLAIDGQDVWSIDFSSITSRLRDADVSGVWTAADGFDPESLAALQAGRMAAVIRVNPAEPRSVRVGDRNFSMTPEISALPASIDRVAVGESYVVEVWTRLRDRSAHGLSSVAVEIAFDSNLSQQISVDAETALPNLRSQDVQRNRGETVVQMVGATLFQGVGTESTYALLGRIRVTAAAEGTESISAQLIGDGIVAIGASSAVAGPRIELGAATIAYGDAAANELLAGSLEPMRGNCQVLVAPPPAVLPPPPSFEPPPPLEPEPIETIEPWAPPAPPEPSETPAAPCEAVEAIEADVELVVRDVATSADEYTVFVANPATDTGHGTGRIRLLRDATGTRLEYFLDRITAIDFDGRRTRDTSDDVVSIALTIDGREIWQIDAASNRTGDLISGAWTEAEGLLPEHVSALRAGRMAAEIRYNPADPRTARVGDRNFSASAELSEPPKSSDRFEIGDSYVVEVWARLRDGSSRGLSSAAVEILFNADISQAISLDRETTLPELRYQNVERNGHETLVQFVGASMFARVGSGPIYALLGRIYVTAAAAGTESISAKLFGDGILKMGSSQSIVGPAVSLGTRQIAYGAAAAAALDAVAADALAQPKPATLPPCERPVDAPRPLPIPVVSPPTTPSPEPIVSLPKSTCTKHEKAAIEPVFHVPSGRLGEVYDLMLTPIELRSLAYISDEESLFRSYLLAQTTSVDLAIPVDLGTDDVETSETPNRLEIDRVEFGRDFVAGDSSPVAASESIGFRRTAKKAAPSRVGPSRHEESLAGAPADRPTIAAGNSRRSTDGDADADVGEPGIGEVAIKRGRFHGR